MVPLRRQPALRLEPEQLEEPVPILLISDDWDVAELYRLKLEVDGYRPTVVRSVRQALTQMPVCCPDIIYFYAGPATESDLQAWRALRDHEAAGRRPIIVLVDGQAATERVRGELRGLDYIVPVDGSLPQLTTAEGFDV
jgi:DNA-binding response OmpR family regulator